MAQDSRIQQGEAEMRHPVIAMVVLLPSLIPGATLGADEEAAPIGAFAPASTLAEARTEHAAALLEDGRVLIAGGRGSD